MANLYSIFDTKASMYGPIISFANDLTAIRSFSEMLVSGDKNSMLSLYPADYLLYCVGSFDQSTGIVQSLPAPQHVISGMECMSRAIDEVNRRKRFHEALNDGDVTKVADYASSPASDELLKE